MNISIIIPTLNEAGHIQHTLESICCSTPGFSEIIVVDGGSEDNTEEACRSYPCRFLKSERTGRGFQMNLGAQMAYGEVLLFLHADTLLPSGAAQAIRDALVDPRVCAGGFSKVFDTRHVLLRLGFRS